MRINEGNPNTAYGTGWYSPNSSTQADLKIGERIYVSYNIEKKHELAFNLAVEHTMDEIIKLYNNAAGVTINGLSLQDIFKMDKATMNSNHIDYDGAFTKL